jgi:phage gp29-like protein
VIEISHNSRFGLINDVAANVIWKRNLLQSNAEFSERFGIPLITATTSNKADVPRINQALKNLGEAGTGVLPNGTDIQVHDLANAGNPEKVYLEPVDFHDKQVSKRFLGSTTIVDEGANRAQTQVHENTLDDKIALDDKRLIMFVINDHLFPLLASFGLPFDNTKMRFQFDETEDMSLTEQWKITNEALTHFDLDEEEIRKTFNLPITGKKTYSPQPGGLSANFR